MIGTFLYKKGSRAARRHKQIRNKGGSRSATGPPPGQAMKRVRAPEHSGKSHQVKIISPQQWKPLRNGIYKIRLTVIQTLAKRKVIIELRDLINLS